MTVASDHPAGLFEATIEDHCWGKSKNTGSRQFVVKFRTEKGAITGFFSMTDAAAGYTIEKIRNMGYEGASLMDPSLNDGTAMRGSLCKIEVKMETYQGVTRPKVAFVHPRDYVPGLRREEGAVNDLKRFDALLRKTPTVAHPPDEPPADMPDRQDGPQEPPPEDENFEASEDIPF